MWAVSIMPKDLGRSMGPSAIPRKSPANTGYEKFVAGIAKSTTTPAHMNMLLIGSHRSDYSFPKEKGYCQVQQRIHWIYRPHSQPPNQGGPSQQAGHAVTGSPHPRCKPQLTGTWESSHPTPRMVSEPPRPKESEESRTTELNLVSTVNPKD